MAFDEELRSYLESVERDASEKEPVRRRRVDDTELRRHLLERLRGLEHTPERVVKLFDQWSPRIEGFARYVESLPLQDAPVEEEAALAFARTALDCAMDIRDAATGLVDRLEMGRMIGAYARAGAIEPYALENRLVHRDRSKLGVTTLGHAFLRLRGKDAVRWLLTLEIAQSRGPWDPWRVPRELLAGASSAHGIQERTDHEGELYFPFAVSTLERLARLEVLAGFVDQHDHTYCYQVRESMRDVVQGVLDVGPWHAAVAALLEDEQAVVLQMPVRNAADATIEQTRMIAHEVRNALVPVRHHLDALLRASDTASRARLESSRRGVVRVLAFVDEMIATSELLNEPPTSFGIDNVIRDALGWLDGGERVELDVSAGSMKVRGRRSRLQRAISNVILNALQATAAGQRVRLQARRSAGMIEIIVDDAGPGVPEESRRLVFHDGFTTRGGVGGSGFGLAYVQRVVEDLHGRVWCETSDLGGARFVMALPEGEADK